MSLPTTGFLLKNGNVVGEGLTNVGWVISPSGIFHCCKEIYSNVKSLYSPSIDGWKTFDQFYLYDYLIDRKMVDNLINDRITLDQFESAMKENIGYSYDEFKSLHLEYKSKLESDYEKSGRFEIFETRNLGGDWDTKLIAIQYDDQINSLFEHNDCINRLKIKFGSNKLIIFKYNKFVITGKQIDEFALRSGMIIPKITNYEFEK